MLELGVLLEELPGLQEQSVLDLVEHPAHGADVVAALRLVDLTLPDRADEARHDRRALEVRGLLFSSRLRERKFGHFLEIGSVRASARAF